MRRHGTGLHWLAAAALAASGCASCLHPVEPTPDAAAQAAALPPACRNHVFVFLIDGPDPFDLANLGGVRQALIGMGYIKVYCGPCWHSVYFREEIRRIHGEDPSARFVLVGFGLGADGAREVARTVQDDGAPIDLLLYCGAVALSDDPARRPANVGRVVSIPGQGIDAVGPALDGADNFRCPDTSHFGSPASAYAIDLLVRQLTASASVVPLVGVGPEGLTGPGQAPAGTARESPPPDEWDFLKPAPAAAPPVMPKAQ